MAEISGMVTPKQLSGSLWITNGNNIPYLHCSACRNMLRKVLTGKCASTEMTEMVRDKEIRQRQSLRLPEYDYSQAGAYFVTICVQGRECLLGEIVDGEIHLNDYGKIVRDGWHNLPHHYPNIELDAFVVMPNHVHGVIVLVGAGLRPAPTNPPLSEIVRAFKSFSSRKINELRSTPGLAVWQRGYYEHIVRDDTSLSRIRDYIVHNPLRWNLDRENLHARGQDDFDRWLASFTTKPKGQTRKP